MREQRVKRSLEASNGGSSIKVVLGKGHKGRTRAQQASELVTLSIAGDVGQDDANYQEAQQHDRIERWCTFQKKFIVTYVRPIDEEEEKARVHERKRRKLQQKQEAKAKRQEEERRREQDIQRQKQRERKRHEKAMRRAERAKRNTMSVVASSSDDSSSDA